MADLLTVHWLRHAQAAAALRQQRLTLWLRGSLDWTAAAARHCVAALPQLEPVCLADRPILGTIPSQPLQRALSLLGRDLELLIVDSWSGFDPDGFGAATGALRGGGVLILLTPPPADWLQRPDPHADRIAVWPFTPAQMHQRFLMRLIQVLDSDPAIWRCDQVQADPLPASLALTATPRPAPLVADLTQTVTADQAAAVAAILSTARGRARRPLVLTAHRGRGKSAALGLAAGHLLINGARQLVVTAPRRAAVATLYRHAEAVVRAQLSATAARHALRFCAPADLLEQAAAADLVFIDEAAGIPTPLLTAWLEHYPRLIFASTVHGYEGTGRGFEIRFRAALERLTPHWRALTLTTPIRWAADDPLEQLVSRALLLDAAPASSAAVLAVAEIAPELIWLDRDALLADEPTLRELFGLLVLAHYQTRPLDLRMLLDGPEMRVLVMRCAGRVVATLLVATEGDMHDPALRAAIFRGERRPRGHLLPQTLSAHAGLRDAPSLRYARVVRLVVHPALTRRGLARRLLVELERTARADGIDLLGASFGATVELLQIWQACGFAPAQMGTRRNAASGEQAVVVLRALSDAGAQLLRHAQQRLAFALPVWLVGPLRTLDPQLAALLIAAVPPDAPVDLPHDWRDEFAAFVAGYRTFTASLPLLVAVTRQQLGAAWRAGRIELDAAALLVAVIVQQQPLTDLAPRYGAVGREALLARVRSLCGELGAVSSTDA